MSPPATQSPQSQAIYVINQYLSLAQQMMAAHDQIKALGLQWTDDAVANTMAQMHTVSVNPDGSLATVVDATNTSTNPLSPATYPTLTRPVSSLQITQVKTVLDAIASFIDGNVVASIGGAHAILDVVTGG